MTPLVAVTLGASAFAGPYRTTDTTRYASTNEYLLWFAQGPDTLGEPIQTVTAELHRITEDSGGLHLNVALEGDGFASSTVFGIDDTGRVITVDGQPVDEVPSARVDVLPRIRLPVEQLTAGATWSDSVSSEAEQPYGATYYTATRNYTVVGRSSIAGIPSVLIVGDGRLALRQGGWQDAQQTSSWWQEVSGPLLDSVWFDPESGRLVADATYMDLVGAGGIRAQGQTLDLGSGLRSSVRRIPAQP